MYDKEVRVGAIRHMSRKLNDGLTCILILRGTVVMQCEQVVLTLEVGDVAVVNDGDVYHLQSEAANIVVMLHFPKAYLINRFEQFSLYRFDCISSSANPEQQKYDQSLQKYIAELAFLHYKDAYKTELIFQSVLFKMLHVLTTQFSQFTLAENEIEDAPLKRALQWIHLHYKQRIGLDDVAQHVFVSPQYLSRLFKTKLDTTFLQYVTQLRVTSAKKDLADSVETVTKIAMANGFANDKALNQAFLKSVQMTASEYRAAVGKLEQPLQQDDMYFLDEDKDVSLEALVKFMDRFDRTAKDQHTAMETIKLNEIRMRPMQVTMNIVDIGHIKNAIRSDVRRQLDEVKEHLQFQFISFDGFVDIAEDAQHDYMHLKLYDLFNSLSFFHELNMTPFIKIQLHSVRVDFQQSLARVLALLKTRYSNEELSKWHFEIIGTEPLLHEYLPVISEVFQMQLVKANIGVRLDADDVTQIIHTVRNAPWHVDFFSYTANPNHSDMPIDSNKYELFQQAYHVNRVIKIRDIVQQSGLGAVPIYLTDWNTLTGSTTVEAGEFHRTALIAHTLCKLTPYVAGFSIRLTLSSEHYSENSMLTHPLSLFIFRNIRRPMFFVFRAYAAMKETVIAEGDYYLFTRDEHGNLALLLYNACYSHPFFALHTIRQSSHKKMFSYKITGVLPSKYRVKKYLLDKDHGSIYSSWLSMDLSVPLDEEDIDDYLEHASNPSVKLYEEKSDGSVTIHEELSMNATALYIFKRYD